MSNFDDVLQDFNFDDGGPDHDWSQTFLLYPDDFGKEWWGKLESEANNYHDLKIPDVDITKMNEDQLLAFKIVMKTL
jgi:type I restriction-modification system DNA methylase subunit